MNPRQRRIRRQRRKQRVRDAESAQAELVEFIRVARENERALERKAVEAQRSLKVASQIETGKAAFARIAARGAKP